MSRTVYFITHPNVIINADVPVTSWPLSELGRERMQMALQQPWMEEISAIYCSTEQKAVDGAEIMGSYLSLPVQRIRALGENDRSATGFLPSSEFERTADEFFANPDLSIRGWERALDAQHRIVSAIETLLIKDQSTGSIAIVSHGAVGALLYCFLKQCLIDRKWDQPGQGGGNYFRFTLEPREAQSGWQPIDSVSK